MLFYDLVIVGGGHAGCEAALAGVRRGVSVALIALRVDTIAQLPCNCSIGGPAKAHLVREVAALGGAMPRVADITVTHSRMLNTSKGPAVQAIRAQVDKELYPLVMQQMLRDNNVEIIEAEVSDIMVADSVVTGVRLSDGREITSEAVVLATGTFLKGRTFTGSVTAEAGRYGEPPASFLSASLINAGVKLGRFKTGTTPRIDVNTINFENCELQNSSETPLPYEFYWQNPAWPERKLLPCHITYTTENTHEILRANLERSALFGGLISGRGPRYCPSIEDKVVRFPERNRHQVFLEREGWESNLVYPMGISTSMPADVQIEFVHSIPGLENAEIVRPGYAVEYDYIPPDGLWPNLESRIVKGLFCAGQVNGTSGYEEAAAQGLIAGINAVQYIRGEVPVVLQRDEAYIGVLIDDLVTRCPAEPYRMLTSRAEHRLLLRQDNADMRLTDYGHELGLIDDESYQRFCTHRDAITNEINRLNDSSPSDCGIDVASISTAADWLRRPEVTYEDLRACDPKTAEISETTAEQVQTFIKYEGYIKRQGRMVEKQKRLEAWKMPTEINYREIRGLLRESADHLERVRPATLGHAARIPGVTPADISLLMVWITAAKRREKIEE
jgi:tRNA uridine 5-carboxymethylaminomethyl modification enzyme